MKKLIGKYLILFLVSVLFSCNKENMETPLSEVQNIKENDYDYNNSSKVKFYVYFADFDEWGRASKGCDGWELCNYVSCWFCCADDENSEIVDCESRGRVEKAGKFVIDTTTDQGYLYIYLNPISSVENDAIINMKLFYVDYDIVKQNQIVHAGDYAFDPSIGNHGGYKLDVTQLKY